ncbi:MAG: inositol monophosphatase [Desulfobulbaceae bacterium]|nr:inositol monophosphatase [Desulfobulbaceae bacterium]
MNKMQAPSAHCTSDEHRQLLAAACRAALVAGRLIKKGYDQPHNITMKGAINLVTEADFVAEAAIIASLGEDTPGLPIMAEESSATHIQRDAKRFWVVDPLDGTTNFAHGFPFFAVSIALLAEGKPMVAAIYAPMFDELFCATRGGGAWLNGRPIQVTGTGQLIEALVGTGFPYELDQTLPGVIRQLTAVLAKVRDIRRAGAAALDLAYVACGRLDGFYEINLQPWDTAAGWLLVEEAGGRVSEFSGGTYSPFGSTILASNGMLHQSLLHLLQ